MDSVFIWSHKDMICGGSIASVVCSCLLVLSCNKTLPSCHSSLLLGQHCFISINVMASQTGLLIMISVIFIVGSHWTMQPSVPTGGFCKSKSWPTLVLNCACFLDCKTHGYSMPYYLFIYVIACRMRCFKSLILTLSGL